MGFSSTYALDLIRGVSIDEKLTKLETPVPTAFDAPILTVIDEDPLIEKDPKAITDEELVRSVEDKTKIVKIKQKIKSQEQAA